MAHLSEALTGQTVLGRPLETVVAALHDPRPLESIADVNALEARLLAEQLRKLGEAGVRLIGQGHWVGLDVRVAAGVELGPNVVLRGRTAIGAGAVVHAGCWLEDTSVAPGAVLLPYTVCEGAEVGEGCRVGPFGRLRPAAVLEKGARVGNFVEVKKSVLREGAKANHLAYIGDAEIGRRANVGAGTITCNYDGFGKHRTEVGPDAFIGSNTSLVAPVTIGEGAIVGAGSVIAKDVPVQSLAVERAELRTLDGKAPRIRERNRRRAEAKKKHG